jgi:hypothetical protein
MEKIPWTRTANGLVINLPATLPCKSSLCFKIAGLKTVSNLPPQEIQAFKDQTNHVPGTKG